MTDPWLWRRPERVATLAFMVGTLASSSALGVAAISAEGQGYGAADIARSSVFGWFVVLTTGIPVIAWGLVVRVALWLRRGFDVALIVVAALAMTVLTLFAVMVGGGQHGQSTALQSSLGLIVAMLLDALRVASFFPVAALVRRARNGDAAPIDVAAAAWAWALAFASTGALIGPGIVFQMPAALMILPAAAGLVHVYARASHPVAEEDASPARATVLRGLGRGALPLAIAAALLVPFRLYEQISTTRNLAQMAIFKARLAHECKVVPAGQEGDVSLWLVDCGRVTGPTLGWDEREHILLRDEQLFQRVPRLRSVPSISTAQPR